MELTWVGVACAAASAVIVPLILHRIFFHETMKHKSSTETCSLEMYMTRHGMDELEAKFQVAVDFVTTRGNNKLTNEQKLLLYAFYKQASFGPCSVDKPSVVDMVGIAKWQSWKALGCLKQDVAKEYYAEWVQKFFEEFDVRGPEKWGSSSEASNKSTTLDGTMGMAGSVSLPKVDMSSEEWKVKQDIFHYASTGHLDKLIVALDQGEDINAQDSHGRTMLHWAVDRDQAAVVTELLGRKASPNVQDADGMTPLHYAVSCEHEEMAKLLVKHGALVDIEDLDGDTPLSTATSHSLQTILADGKINGSY
ncbi:putative acyl-CoA-binding protein, ACBP [Plasmopara halstedii]